MFKNNERCLIETKESIKTREKSLETKKILVDFYENIISYMTIHTKQFPYR